MLKLPDLTQIAAHIQKLLKRNGADYVIFQPEFPVFHVNGKYPGSNGQSSWVGAHIIDREELPY